MYTITSNVNRRISHFLLCSARASEPDCAEDNSTRAEVMSECVSAMSRCRNARAARGYSERSVAAVLFDVDSLLIEIISGGGGGGMVMVMVVVTAIGTGQSES